MAFFYATFRMGISRSALTSLLSEDIRKTVKRVGVRIIRHLLFVYLFFAGLFIIGLENDLTSPASCLCTTACWSKVQEFKF